MDASTKRQIVFVTGGARSGKSRFAQARSEEWLRGSGDRLLYIATGEARDEEMCARIEKHRAQRGERWATLEETLDLAGALEAAAAGRPSGALLDCLTLWASNLLERFGEDETGLQGCIDSFLGTLERYPGCLCLVSNEVGSGIVPENALARRFRDLAGRINQEVALRSTEAYLVVSGLPIRLK